jgi:MYXO-CTERM domain-containing protein
MRMMIAMTMAVGALLVAAPRAEAFCGFYVNGAGSEMFNDATQVVLMRAGTRTVLSMQNNYKGAPEAFALVIPVPTVLQEADVKTLPKEVFAHVDQMGAPRLVEYWEEDPCAPELEYKGGFGTGRAQLGAARTRASSDRDDFGVTIEAQFTVGEYQIAILSAKDAAGLDGWLRAEKYQIPPGAEPFLRPYVEEGMKFFVAKVDPTKVKFEDGRAALSPLRFHYDSETFNLPIRLGLANSSGTQDLIVSILAPGQRYEVANYKNVTIPTNLDVKDAVKDRFGEFYAALFDRTIEKNPGAVVTEYAWQATNCDPCPGPVIAMGELSTLGLDVLGGEKGVAKPFAGNAMGFVLTRLHARYGKTVTEDLVFKAADPIVGGREFLHDNGKLEERSRPDSINNFQARYAIRHEWTGPIQCAKPIRGRWGGPPSGVTGGGVKPALDLAFAKRGEAKLPELVRQDIPELEVTMASAPATIPQTQPPAGSSQPPAPSPAAAPPAQPSAKKSGCGCETGTTDSAVGLGLGGAILATIVRRRRPRR